ncbi:hypothetical protein AAG906_018730 [Vitis piasezkii]
MIACRLSMWAAHLSHYLQSSSFGHFLHFGSYFCKCEALYGLATCYIDVWEHSEGDRHIDANWSPIIEDLYSPELGNPLGCQGSACVEVMTTLHGSASSLRRREEGCVPLEGLRPPRRYQTVGQTSGLYYPLSPHVQYRPRAPSWSYDQAYVPPALALPHHTAQGTERPLVSYSVTTQPCYAAQFATRPTSSYPRPKAQQTSALFTLRTQRQFSQLGMSLR